MVLFLWVHLIDMLAGRLDKSKTDPLQKNIHPFFHRK